MANKTINQLTSLGSVDANDEFVLFDVSEGATKKATKSTLLSGMQTELTFDDTPTNGSSNPVKSGGVYTALSGKANVPTVSEVTLSVNEDYVSSSNLYCTLIDLGSCKLLKLNGYLKLNAGTYSSSTPIFYLPYTTPLLQSIIATIDDSTPSSAYAFIAPANESNVIFEISTTLSSSTQLRFFSTIVLS